MLFAQPLKLIAAVLVGTLVYNFVSAEDAVRTGLVIFSVVACLWLTEAIHISITALLIPVLAVFGGIFSVKEALINFANPIIFLFMGGFALAAALQQHDLDKAFARRVLTLSGGRPFLSIVLLFLTTAILSMWISNTAAVVLMLPMALGLLSERDMKKEKPLFIFVLLGLAYSGNLGGMVTLIGSPPNAIAAAAIGISFSEWLRWGLPLFLCLFPLMIALLYLMLRPNFGTQLSLNEQDKPMNKARLQVLGIFAFTSAAWIFSTPLSRYFGIESGFDSLVAVVAIVLLTGSGSITVPTFVAKTQWSILLLFGGGLTLSALLQASAASEWLAHAISNLLPQGQPWLILLIVCLFVIFLTELVSNTASAALLVPIFISVAIDMELSPSLMALMIAFCASCAFMLPVATPPNALVFATGCVSQQQMMRTGLMLNIIMAFIIATLTFWLL